MQPAKSTVSKEVVERLLDVEKLKYCYECGICTASCSIAEMLGNGYNPRMLLEKIVCDPEHALSSSELWLCAWCYRCHNRCNQALRLPEIFLYMRTIAKEQGYSQPFEDALKKIVENIPLPLVTTFVCFHPERAGLDREKVLEKVEQLYAEHLKNEKAKRAQKAFEERIAVIGSGPAGLAVAYELSIKGYGVTVFESLPEPGGMLRKCIPEDRLPRHVLNKEIQYLKDLGVEIKTGINVGKDLAFADLRREGFKAVFVGAGAHGSQKLKIEGVELKGVIHALEFLWDVNRGNKVDVGKNTVVIGGGNVAMDTAKTAAKLGANVTVLYRRSRDEMPAIPWEVRDVEDEGIKIEFLTSPKRMLGNEGKVSEIECVRMQLGEPDESGRRSVSPIEGSEFKHSTDMVILATGEKPDLSFLPKETELNDDGSVWVNPITLETSLPGAFAGGDAITGPATVIEAIRDGKNAASSIVDYLERLREVAQ